MKFKELRMFIFTSCLFLLTLSGTIYFIIEKSLARILIASLITFMILMMVLTRYNMKVFNDSLLGYEWIGIGIMPVLIEFKDIRNMKYLSKHKIQIEHTHKTILYVVNAEAFYQELEKHVEVYKKDDE